jgi:hypothetical protein
VPDRVALAASVAIIVVITQAHHFTSNPDPFVAAGFVTALVLVIVLDRQARRWRGKMHKVAIEAWQREFAERMRIELDRGVTDTMARFMVEPVMERCFPRTYEDAVVFLDSRGIIIHNAEERVESDGHGGTAPFR